MKDLKQMFSCNLSMRFFILLIFASIFSACNESRSIEKRVFSSESFWNQPIGDNPEIDPKSDQWIAMLEKEPTGENFGIMYSKWTVPVYEVDSTIPVYEIKSHYLSDEEKQVWDTERDSFGHGPDFNPVPIPDIAIPDPEGDAHIVIIDRQRRLIWDMWGFQRLADGNMFSNTGMKYSLDGMGVFQNTNFAIKDGESVHFHGPSRASGVPVVAGLIMYDEVMSGEIRHKLSFATRYGAFQEFIYPAAWTDGTVAGGIPEGAVMQLDPKLDLQQFDLTPEEQIVAIALQKYGMVLVDMAQGQPIYAEGLWAYPEKTWKGKLREWDGGINNIPYKHFRVLKVGETIKRGDARSLKHSYIYTAPEEK